MMGIAAALAAVLTACGDDVTDPDSGFASAEAEAVMRSAGALPSLPDLVDLVAPGTPEQQAMLYRARELWDAGVASDRARGDARRRLAAGYAAPILAATLPDDALHDARSRIEDWHGVAEGMLQHVTLPAVEERLRSARRALGRADAAADSRVRVYNTLLAISELVETTPRFVARSLAADADAAVRRAEARGTGEAGSPAGDEAPTSDALERARRLTDWAARAVEEGEYLLAIQRAYYAIQLAEGR